NLREQAGQPAAVALANVGLHGIPPRGPEGPETPGRLLRPNGLAFATFPAENGLQSPPGICRNVENTGRKSDCPATVRRGGGPGRGRPAAAAGLRRVAQARAGAAGAAAARPDPAAHGAGPRGVPAAARQAGPAAGESAPL